MLVKEKQCRQMTNLLLREIRDNIPSRFTFRNPKTARTVGRGVAPQIVIEYRSGIPRSAPSIIGIEVFVTAPRDYEEARRIRKYLENNTKTVALLFADSKLTEYMPILVNIGEEEADKYIFGVYRPDMYGRLAPHVRNVTSARVIDENFAKYLAHECAEKLERLIPDERVPLKGH